MWKLLNEATIDSVLLAAIEQFEDQTSTRLLITVLEEYEESGTTHKEDVKKTPAKMLPSTLSKHCMCTICIFVVNDFVCVAIPSSSFMVSSLGRREDVSGDWKETIR